jgi:hypothetical protein
VAFCSFREESELFRGSGNDIDTLSGASVDTRKVFTSVYKTSSIHKSRTHLHVSARLCSPTSNLKLT